MMCRVDGRAVRVVWFGVVHACVHNDVRMQTLALRVFMIYPHRIQEGGMSLGVGMILDWVFLFCCSS